MSKLQSFKNLSFSKELTFPFHHQDSIASSRNHNVHVCFFKICSGRVCNQLSVDSGHLHRCGGAIERNVTQLKSGRCPKARQHFNGKASIVAQCGCNHLSVMTVTFGETRANGTIDQTRRQCRVCCGTSFAFKVTTGDFSGGIKFFLILYREWEEVQL